MTNVTALPQSRRRTRNPQHTFNVRHAPYEIQPFFIAPVLPGETLRRLTFQSRALTNPLKSSLIGWWIEHFFFYVRLTDIDAYYGETVLKDMLVFDAGVTGHADYRSGAAADRFYYWSPDGAGTLTGMDYVRACLKVVVSRYFRDQDAAWDQYTIDGNPAAYLQNTTAFDSALLETAMDAAVDVSIDVDATPTPDTVSVRDVLEAMRQYQQLYDEQLTVLSFEDYLRGYGVGVKGMDMHTPELLRYLRDWQYPSSHVVPDTVTAGDSDVTSAVSWVIAEKADKARFFKEPGFVFGVTVARPKVYLSKQKAPLVSLLQAPKDWLPSSTMQLREAGWHKVTDAATDVLGGSATGDWWIDLRDLFLYGDQFVAGDTVDLSTATDINAVALPAADLDARGPVQASVDALFVSGDATGGVRQDGVVRMAVSSHIADLSPRGSHVRLAG